MNYRRRDWGTFDIRELGPTVHVAPQIGDWHAQIGSYEFDSGCREAKEDAKEFANLLSGTELSGREVSVLNDGSTGYFVVTVDTNGDEDAAGRAVSLIRTASRLSADGRAGADAFVRRKDQWYIDPVCAETYVIPSSP